MYIDELLILLDEVHKIYNVERDDLSPRPILNDEL